MVSKQRQKGDTEPKDEHAVCAARLAEVTDIAKRTQADFENYKKRAEAEKAQYLKYAGSLIIAKLLPLLDTFDSAVKNTANKDVIAAVELIRTEVTKTLKAEGVGPIKSVGEHFDPFKHEALMIEQTHDAAKDNIVLEEFQKGYMLHDKVVRHSKVKVAKYKESSHDNATETMSKNEPR